MLLLETSWEKLWIISNPKIKNSNKQNPTEHEGREREKDRGFIRSLSFSRWQCAVVAGPGRRIAHRPGVTHHTHTQQKALCPCSPTERCYSGPTVTQHSPAGEQNRTSRRENWGERVRISGSQPEGASSSYLITFPPSLNVQMLIF